MLRTALPCRSFFLEIEALVFWWCSYKFEIHLIIANEPGGPREGAPFFAFKDQHGAIDGIGPFQLFTLLVG